MIRTERKLLQPLFGREGHLLASRPISEHPDVRDLVSTEHLPAIGLDHQAIEIGGPHKGDVDQCMQLAPGKQAQIGIPHRVYLRVVPPADDVQAAVSTQSPVSLRRSTLVADQPGNDGRFTC